MKKIALSLIISCGATVAIAQNFYAGFGLGTNTVSNDTSTLKSDLTSALGGTATVTQSTSVGNTRLIGGYKVNQNWATEVGYLNSSKFNVNFNGVSSGSVAYAGNGNVSFSGFDVSAVYKPDAGTGLENFFANVGVHNYKAKVGLSITANSTTTTSNTSQSGTGYLYGFGYELPIGQDFGVRFAVTRLNKLAGDSSNYTTNYGVSVVKQFN
jgi:hypothetical protein